MREFLIHDHEEPAGLWVVTRAGTRVLTHDHASAVRLGQVKRLRWADLLWVRRRGRTFRHMALIAVRAVDREPDAVDDLVRLALSDLDELVLHIAALG
jgi:hypothetical protein